MKIIQAGHGVMIIALDETLTLSSGKELLTLAGSFSSDSVKTVLLDFGNSDMLDNTGLNVLVKFSLYAHKAHKKLLATGLNKKYLDLFSMTGLDRAYRVFASQAAALRKAGLSSDPEDKALPLDSQRTELRGPEYWSPSIKRIPVPAMPPQAINLNVNGRRTAGPDNGFGQLWEKTYTIDLSDSKLSPEEIISILKSKFPEFQPPENRFYPTPAGIKPGEVVLINASTPGGMVATGVLVLYAGPCSFTFITPQGHPEAGWVTFRSFEEDGRTFMQVQGLARASDPIYEAAFRIAGSTLQQQIWTHLLESLANYTGSKSAVSFNKECLDNSLQWSNCLNLFRNAQISSILFSLTHPSHKQKHAM